MLEQFQNVLLTYVYKKCQYKSQKTWHSLTSKVFFPYMYKVWINLFLSSQGGILLIFYCSFLFLLIFINFFTSYFYCSSRFLWLWMWLLSYIMKRFLIIKKSPPSSFKSVWKAPWSQCTKIIILHFANISCVWSHTRGWKHIKSEPLLFKKGDV
jgi:hypothetical protein